MVSRISLLEFPVCDLAASGPYEEHMQVPAFSLARVTSGGKFFQPHPCSSTVQVSLHHGSTCFGQELTERSSSSLRMCPRRPKLLQGVRTERDVDTKQLQQGDFVCPSLLMDTFLQQSLRKVLGDQLHKEQVMAARRCGVVRP